MDGTLYQTLDLKERAKHATIANTRSIGIEISNIGAYQVGRSNPFDKWYTKEQPGNRTRLVIPEAERPWIRTPNFVGRYCTSWWSASAHSSLLLCSAGYPARPDPVRGMVQGLDLLQMDFTQEQYSALIRLTAALAKLFPGMPLKAPRNEDGSVRNVAMSAEELDAFAGIVGHFHVQTNKQVGWRGAHLVSSAWLVL